LSLLRGEAGEGGEGSTRIRRQQKIVKLFLGIPFAGIRRTVNFCELKSEFDERKRAGWAWERGMGPGELEGGGFRST